MSADASSEANRDDGCEWYFGVPFPSKRKAAGLERGLRVGDRVKMHGCYSFDPGFGTIVQDCGHYFEVKRDVAPYGIQAEWAYSPESLTLLPPTFPSGTRVRVVRNTNRYAVGDTGTVTLSSDESVGVRMDDGRYWSFKPEDLAVVQDGAEPAPDCAGRNGEQDTPKFKAGDVVRALVEDWSGDIEPGDIFTLIDAHDESVELIDRDGDSRLRPADEFELVTSAPCPQDNTIHIGEFKANLGDVLATASGRSPEPCIVIRQVDGQPRPSSRPHVHQSAADATKEAERLASVNPGKQFDVYQRVTGRVGEVQVREVA